MTPAVPLVDLALSRRLERAEAHANRRFVESRARRVPELGAGWIDAGGAYALFDGVGSPLTQTFGLGVFEPVTPAVLETLETFFTSRGSDTLHEVSPLADSSALALLAGASTVPGARGQGAQRALLATRLAYAAAEGCTMAMMGASPGSGSQRNAERSGFRIAYTRIKWHRAR